jgi:DNA-binding SARP family transcriptional activator
VPLQLVTFGGLHAVDDTGELDRLLAQHSRAALLVHLAVERRVSRESLMATFWPESDAENARHALRQSLYQLRRTIGGRVRGELVESRAHELVVSDELRADAVDFTQALERGDVESAVRLYRGPFLDGVHLVDLQSWESWVDGRRAQYARAFRKACRELIEARRAAGDLAGAIEAAERWAARDPSDGEAQHRLIEALAAAGERAEAIRQYETYERMLGSDGLAPPDETRALAGRLRSDPAPLPALRAAAATAGAPARDSAPAAAPVAAHGRAGARRPRRLLRLLPPAAALLVLLASMWGVRRRESVRPPAPSATTIAVLPFAVRGGDAVRYLGEGLVSLLDAALDGTGSLRPADTRATFAAVAALGGSVPDAEHGERVARRLGAGMFVLGDVVEAGGTIQIEAAVHDAGAGCDPTTPRDAARSSCAPGEPLTRAVVSGPADSVFALVDRLAARLLGGLGHPPADRLTRIAALTTASLPALKAYLQGEGLMRAGRFEQAADAYLAAIALDSTFALAHYRLALAREWAPLPGNADAASAAARHGARLSARDRSLLEAFRQWRGGDAIEADRAYRAILARYPDDVDAWFQLGEIQFHHGPLLGRPLVESEEAWRRVLSHEPRNLFALTHLARIVLAAGRLAALDSLLAPFGDDALRSDRRLEEPVLLRAVARGDTAAARALARVVRRGEGLAVWRVAAFLTAFAPDPAIMREVIRELSADHPDAALRADLLWFASILDLARGRARAAGVTRAEAVEVERTVPADRARRAFDVVTEWHAATLPLPYADSTLVRVRRRAASLPADSAMAGAAFGSVLGMGLPIRVEPVRQYTLGTLALRLGDTASAAAAAATLRRLAASGDATPLVRDLDRGLRARVAWHRGHPHEALRLLETLEYRDMQGDVTVTPFAARANERFLHAEVLAALGRDADALRWLASLGAGSVTEVPLRGVSHYRQGELHERLGARAEAARHYARFLELWRDADPELRPLVDSARRRLAGLRHTDRS